MKTTLEKLISVKVIITVSFIGLLFIADTHAISPENHYPVTMKAMSVYRNCTQKLGVTDSLTEGINTIVESTGIEDESPLITRYFNWHFYDAYKDTEYAMGRSISGARKSLHHIYDERADALIEALDKNQKDAIYEYTGRLLHYIQDMTVPAHVAPIYHYKFLWFDESDYFDEMPEWTDSTYTQAETVCDIEKVDIGELKEKFKAILDETAKGTRNRIREKIIAGDGHRLHGKTWEEFWILRNPDDDKYSGVKSGFSTYGNENADGFEKLCTGSSSDRELCMRFFEQSFDSAIASTVKTLLLINYINLEQMKPLNQ